MADVSDAGRCRSCGSPLRRDLIPPGPCPACLLSLALDDDPLSDAPDPLVPGPIHRVLTILGGDDHRRTYLAEQPSTRTLVAMDIVRPSRPGDTATEAFKDRLAGLKRLDHPCIARVMAGHITADHEFCVIARYVTGSRIDRYCATKRPSPAARAQLFAAVCGAIEHAHRLGVPHGRLSPACVLVTDAGDDAQPIVTGFSMWGPLPPTDADDVEGLRALGRAMGGPDIGVQSPPTIAALCDAMVEAWMSDQGSR